MPSVTRRPEKAIEAEFIRNLHALGFQVTKTSQPRPSMITRGIPDLYASHPRWGIRLWIEVKAGSNQPSPHQIAWHKAEREAGGNVVTARSWSEVQDELVRLGAPIR
jgi:hypothetical protein